ncbi:refilin-B-like [Megalops cyprinoides]|uniref:refilin-B-like n=1 Tax=Megalops cyprinoides TaxID=118141 RepID=UPI001864BFA1|nr:refilin-B-like [Megalops cyprinoides]
MVGRLNLQDVSDEDPLDMSGKAQRALDSPDSGVPPSPSPTSWLLSPIDGDEGQCCPVSEEDSCGTVVFPRFYALSYGEGVELDPLPPTEVRYTSSVRYDSDRHYIDGVWLQPQGLALESCSQTVVALSHSTWRHYKTQLELFPRPRAQRHQSTTIVYPKCTQTFYTTQLHLDFSRLSRRFLSRVELEPGESAAAP